tara:strand:- start:433 stop:762 length:330 start_codon:yes stop_codon:yes gene_type:complete
VKHILFELRGCPEYLLDSEEFVRLFLYTAAKKANSELLNINTHKFEPQGVTGLAMLADSHISIHTWPEKNLAMCDIFTCGVDSTPMEAVKYLCEKFQSKDLTYSHHERI